MDPRSHTRAVGARLAIGADALFLIAIGFTCFHVRHNAAEWPGTPNGLAGDPAMPWIACGLVLFAAGLVRRAMPRILAFLVLAGSLGVMALFVHQLQLQGLSVRIGQYGAALFAASAIWVIHLAGAFVFCGATVRRLEPAPALSLFLAVVGITGALTFSAILL